MCRGRVLLMIGRKTDFHHSWMKGSNSMTFLHRLVVGTVIVTGFSTASARAAEPDKLLPASSDSVLQVNVRQILDSDISKKYALEPLKQLLDGNDAKKILTELGLDPLKDIDQLIMGGSGTSKDDAKVLFIVHGKFNVDKLMNAAETQTKKDPDSYSKIKEGNTTIYKALFPNTDQPVYAAILDENTIVAATEKKMITTAVKANDGNEPANIKGELATLIKKIDSKSSIFAATIVKGKLDEVKIPGGGNLPVDLTAFQDLIPKIETLSFAVQVKSDVNVEITLGMKNENAAGDFQTAFDEFMKQVKPLIQIAGAAEPRAKPVIDILGTIKSSTKNKDVIIVGKVTGANIAKMVNPDD
jgi:hypothetical protein